LRNPRWPDVAIDKSGRIAVAYAIFKDSAFNGQVLVTRSSDGGRTFAPSRPITLAAVAFAVVATLAVHSNAGRGST
jgi:hypothetical protein